MLQILLLLNTRHCVYKGSLSQAQCITVERPWRSHYPVSSKTRRTTNAEILCQVVGCNAMPNMYSITRVVGSVNVMLNGASFHSSDVWCTCHSKMKRISSFTLAHISIQHSQSYFTWNVTYEPGEKKIKSTFHAAKRYFCYKMRRSDRLQTRPSRVLHAPKSCTHGVCFSPSSQILPA